MRDTLRLLRSRKETLRRLREIDDRKDHVVVVHYSCESFSPRVTSIAVRNLGSGQTESFSIHRIAKLKKISLDQIANHYDQLEKEMLDEFAGFYSRTATAHGCTGTCGTSITNFRQ